MKCLLRVGALFVSFAGGLSWYVHAQTLAPVNYSSVNFSPITTSTSYNYDWSTGTLVPGSATGTVFSTAKVFQNLVIDPTPPDPNGYGTFIGTARPMRSPTGGGAVLYEQSVCGSGYPTCFSDGTFTYGNMVMYPLRGATLDLLTYLATQYYVDDGGTGSNCFGGGYSGAITCANGFGLTINAIFLSTDGGNIDTRRLLYNAVERRPLRRHSDMAMVQAHQLF